VHLPIVLFVCTRNTYRSRFAEAFFNHATTREGLPFRAESRGLNPPLVLEDTISLFAEGALRSKKSPSA
jgi:protein-tyrosine-phosphatase